MGTRVAFSLPTIIPTGIPYIGTFGWPRLHPRHVTKLLIYPNGLHRVKIDQKKI